MKENFYTMMKKMIIVLLCITLCLGNSLNTYAMALESETENSSEQNSDSVVENLEDENSYGNAALNTDLDSQPEERCDEQETENEVEEALSNENIVEVEEEVSSESSPMLEENVLSENIIEDDDPQQGRENGYLFDVDMLEAVESISDAEYIHSPKYKNYIIKDVIDVSKYQGDISWGTVKQAGIDYAIIRAGYRGYGESGSLNTDSSFKRNVEQAIQSGVQVGVYFFSQAITEEEAVAEAEYVLELIKDYEISLPVVIDYEYATSSEGLIGRLYGANLSKEDATQICIKFCDVVEEKGYTAMVYANKDMLENGLDAAQIAAKYKVWLAHYTTSSTYQGEYQFWQYTQKGAVEGISGNVDKNFWYYEEKASCTIYNGVDYSAVYDYSYYTENNPDIKKAFGDDEDAALRHFVLTGMSEGRIGNESFNVYTYRNRYADLRRTYGKDWKKYYEHYLKYGKEAGYDGSGTSELLDPLTVFGGVDYSAVYDYNYYTENNADIKKAFGDDEYAVLRHFVLSGIVEGRIGNESFNVYTYRNRYADLRRAYGTNWKSYYTHYLNNGIKEGRDGSGTSKVINPLTAYNGVDYSAVYDYSYYTENNPDLEKAFGEDEYAVLRHFVLTGMSEGRIGNEEFNVYTYRNRYVDLRKVYGTNWKSYYTHYLNNGIKEGRDGSGTSELLNPVTIYNGKDYSAVYDFHYYTEKYPDIKKAYGDDDLAVLKHFVLTGMNEGRQGNAAFNVYSYKENYVDLANAFGNNLKSYYLHYINNGYYEGRTGVEIGKFISCEIVEATLESATVQIEIELNDAVEDYEEYYVVEVDSYNGKTIENIIAKKSGQAGNEIIHITGSKEEIHSMLMNKFALAFENSDGKMYIVSKPIAISNPEAIATNTTAIFKGTSKKGLQGITYASYNAGDDIVDARNANTKQTLLNLDIASIVSTTQKSGYTAYTYKGNTYYFSDLAALKASISSMNSGYKQYLYGNSDTTPVAVTLCLLLSYNSENSYLIDPAARVAGHSYYMLNVREEKARETLEALFLYLGETFGQENCYVSNWVLGNEINSSKAWNYSGSLDFETYMDCYAAAFRLLYNGVKSTKTGNTVGISLDNGWTAAPDTYAGKTTLDAFARKIHELNSNIDWSIAYHAYSYPLTRADFWNDYSNTTDSLSTKYISMRNISVLTNYAGTLENTYGKAQGTIRVLLTEQGYSYGAGAELQGQAIARGFYIAQFNDRIDAFIIRAVVDDKDETSGKLYFGLMNSNTEKRIAFYVYEYMDSDIDKFSNVSASGTVSSANYSKFNKAKEIVCNTNWSSIVPGYDKTLLANIK